ncbi:hypothetical protein [Mycolicibacterium peregrinum]|uniref:Uncharacterized protein n=1 Tax=Mycolicibacterium peregrinum TaxID=43304 RepID=A0A1A0VN37_MYCPR|nr:hypothetical protein [Mycolicibacterium peregrinum]OBB84667.1 hypothetical protein A5779_05745 [Mycolicibacterium peregrinum]
MTHRDGVLLDSASVDSLADAVAALNPKPRERRWTSLSLCIADAVWSIGADYDAVVVPVVRKLAANMGVHHPTVPARQPIGTDPLPLTRLIALTVDELTGLTNRQRTSTRNGILKSEAVLRHARVFVVHGVVGLPDAVGLFTDTARFTAIDDALRAIPGEGGHGVRRNYLWMLIGDDDLIKPDRMVLRWLAYHGVDVDPVGARDVIAALVSAVGARLERDVTAWEIDHAIWDAGRQLWFKRSRRRTERSS